VELSEFPDITSSYSIYPPEKGSIPGWMGLQQSEARASFFYCSSFARGFFPGLRVGVLSFALMQKKEPNLPAGREKIKAAPLFVSYYK
jgi:hypothetical protein